MVRVEFAVLVLIAASVTAIPPGAAALLTAYDLVGIDPVGDAKNMIVPGNDATPTTLSRGKQDINSLEMANDGAVVHFKMNIEALYYGTSSLLYVVHFKVAGTSYFVCWNIQSAGQTTSSNDVAEDMSSMACSTRFPSETRVGPGTRAAGVQVANANDKNFVRWEVTKASIGDPGADGVITDIVAETWNRGGNVDYAPATSPQSLYVWNLADRAPDTATWTYPLAPPSPALSIGLNATTNATAVGPGMTATFDVAVSLIGNGSANVSFAAEGLPEGWTLNATDVMLNESANSTVAAINVDVPADAENQTIMFALNATAPGNISATVNLTIVVDSSVAPPPPTGGTDNGGANTTQSNDAGSAKEGDGGGIPGPSAALGLVAVALATLFLVRRRRA